MKTKRFNLKKIVLYIKPEILYLLSRNKNVKETMKYQSTSRYLKKNYIDKYNFRKDDVVLSQKAPKIIWIYWRQGIDNAPLIVKHCVSRIEKIFKPKGYEINILDMSNVFNYIDIPDYIMNKYNKKIISDAHLSDLIRLQLLIKYGGCWMDGTLLFTEIDKGVPEYLTKYPFFVFSNEYKNNDFINISNWLINSVKNNEILIATRNILFNYWEKENIAVQYYIFHLIFKMVTDKYKTIWENVPIYTNIYPHLLIRKINKVYNHNEIKDICSKTRIHKLTYKNLEYADKNNTLNAILDNKI